MVLLSPKRERKLPSKMLQSTPFVFLRLLSYRMFSSCMNGTTVSDSSKEM